MKHRLDNVKGAMIFLMVSVRVRILDHGGWLDTWFAIFGQVLNLAVLSRPFGSEGEYLAIDVLFNLDTEAKRSKGSSGKAKIIAASDPNFSITYERRFIKPSSRKCKKNLLLAVLSLCELDRLPKGDLVFRIQSPVQPGASMGTSAAVAVALIKAVKQLQIIYCPGLPVWTDEEIAEKAFLAETKVMKGQSGTQDQWSAAFDWIAKSITIEQYPKTIAREIKLSRSFRQALERGLITIFVGSHNSSATHLKVIRVLEQLGSNAPALQPIRRAVELALAAVKHGSIHDFGAAMTANTEAQRAVCSELVGSKHQQVIELAKNYGCLGYKVNGAGGEGGSVSILFDGREVAEDFYSRLKELYPEFLAYEHKL